MKVYSKIPANVFVKVMNKCSTGIDYNGSRKRDMIDDLQRAERNTLKGYTVDTERAHYILEELQRLYNDNSHYLSDETIKILKKHK